MYVIICREIVCTRGFTKFGEFEDLNFKISEGYDQNWGFPDSAQLAVSV